MTLFFFWITVCGFVRNHRYYGYFGVISSISTILIVLGHVAKPLVDINVYAVSRVQQNLLGIIVCLVVNTFIWPITASQSIRDQVIKTLQACQQAITQSLKYYEETKILHERQKEKEKEQHPNFPIDHSPVPATSTIQTAILPVKVTIDSMENRDSSAIDKTNLSNSPSNQPSSTIAAEIINPASDHSTLINTLALSDIKLRLKQACERNSGFAASNGVISVYSDAIRSSFDTQLKLTSAAIREPHFFGRAFAAKEYLKLVNAERKIWRLIVSCDRALIRMRQHAGFDLMVPNFDLQFHQLESQVTGALKDMSKCMQYDFSINQLTISQQKLLSLHHLSIQFIHSHDLWISDFLSNVQNEKVPIVSNATILSLNAFLYSTIRLVEEIVIMGQILRQIVQVERPADFQEF